ncbi:PREDICTED: outer envelope pore protein 16-2, chloroplastic [Tarenaya hassleriana]|uniref:outer envelope pore protein 16-2, chloroplastic n=1 Tax=Tarenaya hassleriana TaxID=28532 RepID=UPI00053C1B66|nr:PREDICTED: outer envelope pore protein 16-2, chloroplastic [Tarenaya hassleriana]
MEKGSGRKVMDEIRRFEKLPLFDLGHPLLDRIADSFVKAAGIGAAQAVSREAYSTVFEGTGLDSSVPPPSEVSASKKNRFPNLNGESSTKSLEALVKNTGKESMQWGLAAGLYSGLTYGLSEARGAHDWKNSAVAGALTGVAMAMTLSERTTHEQVVQCALTGAAISTAANLLSGVF